MPKGMWLIWLKAGDLNPVIVTVEFGHNAAVYQNILLPFKRASLMIPMTQIMDLRQCTPKNLIGW